MIRFEEAGFSADYGLFYAALGDLFGRIEDTEKHKGKRGIIS